MIIEEIIIIIEIMIIKEILIIIEILIEKENIKKKIIQIWIKKMKMIKEKLIWLLKQL